MKLIDADLIARSMTPRTLVDALRSGHAAATRPRVERMLLCDEGNPDSCLIWGGWQGKAGIAVKIASVFPGNEARTALPNIQSVVVLMDGETGQPQCVIHGEAFTRMKTAADSALGTDILARTEPTQLTVLGAGGQAETHIHFLLAVRPSISTVRIWNRSIDRAVALARKLSDTYDGRITPIVAADVEDAVRGSDVVTCLTASGTPILRGECLKSGAHVDLVGGYTPAMRECDDATVMRARRFADSFRFTIDVCGDYADPIARGVIAATDIEADLFGLCAPGANFRRQDNDITMFKNGGGGHLDLFAAVAFREFAAQFS